MRTFFVLLLCGGLWAGCSTVRNVPRDASTPEFQKAKKSLAGQDGLVAVVDSSEMRVGDIELASDSLSFHSEGSDRRISVPLSSVVRINIADATMGAVRGAAWFGLGGACLGYMVGYLQGPWNFYGHGPNTYVAQSMAWGAAIGVVCGAIYGLHNPLDHIYYFGIVEEPIKPVPEEKPRLQPVTLHMSMLPGETADAVKIVWNGHDIWLKKSDIKIERMDDGIWLTVPGQLLE